MADWRDDVLQFWFGELTNEDRFGGAADVDAKIRERFGSLCQRLSKAVPPQAMTDPMTALAAVIVYDQFPRNIHRGKPEAFASDRMAVEVARNALEKGLDREIAPERRAFLYMPFMHSEALSDQERCVELFRSVGNEEAMKYAVEHRDIIARFGRFPHRNRALGRQTTPAEAEFMKTHSGYGQKSDEPDQA